MKAKRIITIIVTALAVLMVVLSGIFKFTMSEQIMTAMAKFGVEKYVIVLGAMEVGFALLYLYPKTMKIGFLLLICYFAGALATELSHDMPFSAITPMVLIWVSAYLRDSSIFISKNQTIA